MPQSVSIFMNIKTPQQSSYSVRVLAQSSYCLCDLFEAAGEKNRQSNTNKSFSMCCLQYRTLILFNYT